jgi:hypothetical protein
MLMTSSNTAASSNWSGDPKSWQAMIIMACELAQKTNFLDHRPS